MRGVETERGAAVLPDDPAIRQDDTAAGIHDKDFNKADTASPLLSITPIQTVSPGPFPAPWGGLPIVDVFGRCWSACGLSRL